MTGSRDLARAGWQILACPVCTADLGEAETRSGAALGCPAGHRFDVARQGYVTLLAPGARLDTGDSPGMVQARNDFLGRGHYAPISDALARLVVRSAATGPVLEVGAGTGHYLRVVLDALTADGVALDASKYAARRAAADPRVAAVVADAWATWPVRTSSVGVVLTVFAPRNGAETRRVLQSGGAVAVVVPEPDHQAELREPLGLLSVDAGKAEALIGLYGAPIATETVRYRAPWSHAAVAAAVGMGPTARHLGPDELDARVAALPETVPVTVAVSVSVFRP